MSIAAKNVSGGNGIPYTYEASGPAAHALISNSTYFKDLTDGLIYYKNSVGDVVGLFTTGIDSVNHGDVYYVSPEGNDASGSAGNINKPYLTLEGARDAALTHKRRRFTISNTAQADITIDGTPYTSNLGTAALNAAALAAAIGVNATYIAATSYFEVEIEPTFTVSGLTANIYTSSHVNIHVFAGTYVVTTTDTNGLAVDGASWYFAPSTIVTKATAGVLLGLTQLMYGCNMFGYADITTTSQTFSGSGSVATFDWLIELNSCTSSGILDASTAGIATRCYLNARKSLISSGNVAAATNTGHYTINCPYIQGNTAFGVNTGVLTCAGGGGTSCNVTADVIVNTGAGLAFESYSSTSVYIKARDVNRIRTSSPSRLDVTTCTALYASGGTIAFNGHVTNVEFSGGSVHCNTFDNLTGTATSGYFAGKHVSGTISCTGGVATSLEKVFYDLHSTPSSGNYAHTISGASYVNLLGAWRLYGGFTVNDGGVVHVKGIVQSFYIGAVHFIRVNTGGMLILEGKLIMEEDRTIASTLIGLDGGHLICKGGTILTPNLAHRPIVAITAPRDIKVYGGGLVSDNLYMLTTTKNMNGYDVTAVAATSIDVDGTTYSEADTATYNTVALLANRIVSLINAGSPDLNVYRATTYGTAYTTIIIVHSAIVINNLVNITVGTVGITSFALTPTILAGNIVLDEDVV